jgi:hypothetical protein
MPKVEMIAPEEDTSSTTRTFLTEEIAPPKEPPKREHAPVAEHRLSSQDIRMSEPSTETIPTWFKPKARTSLPKHEPAAKPPKHEPPTPSLQDELSAETEKRGFVGRIKDALLGTKKAENGFLNGRLSGVEQRIDTLEALCDKLAHPTVTEERDPTRERLQMIETSLARLSRMERDQRDSEILLQRLQKIEQSIEEETADLNTIIQRLQKLEEGTADLNTILQRLQKLEEASSTDAITDRLDKMQEALDSTTYVKEALTAAEDQVTKLSKRLDVIVTTLKDSIGFGIHREFSCKSCGTKGYVALNIRCTQCGKEGWMGWWPEK